MPLDSLPTTIHRRILSFLPWQSHIPVSNVCQFWNDLLSEDQFKLKRYSFLNASEVIVHQILVNPCIGFKVRFDECGPRGALVGMDFYTTEFAKTRGKSALLRAMARTLAGEYSCFLKDPLFPKFRGEVEDPKDPATDMTTTITAKKPNKLKRHNKADRNKKNKTFLDENNNVSTRWPMSIRIGILNDPNSPADDLVNINLAEGSKNRDLTVGELLQGIAEAVTATGPRKKLDYISFELEMWQWLPQHHFGIIRKTNDPFVHHPLMRELRTLVKPGWRGKRARLAWRLKNAAKKFVEMQKWKDKKEEAREREILYHMKNVHLGRKRLT
ncbi:hypothetical protein TWF718_005275 [Orbilia javanica]|uniref:F-box domain-containing protein n=1 Tax=Orbilia javanica TaxID=47235 RepID=A0AAN8MRT0_9PEZI